MSMGTSAPREQVVAIDPRTAMGTVRLTVSDLGRSTTFYEQAIGSAADRARQRSGRAQRARTARRWWS